ncbi:MAG TPA: GNAT family N-acetyltransferase, partial [Vicinamibacterales bacterium]
MPVTLRAAEARDAGAIAAIHNEGIEDRLATLETALRTSEATRHWLLERSPRYAVIVAVRSPSNGDGPEVIGWASLNRFNPRAAYDHVADFSVYVRRDWRGHGVGRQLLDELVDRARAGGFHKMVLSALARNGAGVALYESAGFSRVGVYREMGWLDDQWV